MCGLVGMIGDIDKDDRTMFRQMLIVDALRGHHSTGVAMANAKQETSVFKKALNPVDLMQLNGFEDVVAWDAQMLIGHNRYATVGKINNATAHPFESNDMIGAHNGTLTNWFGLDDSRQFTVDSECLVHNIGLNGFQKALGNLTGAWALTVYDQDSHQFHMIRNKERPLFFTYKEDGSVMYWASEAWMIRDMAARCGIRLDKNIIQPKENHLLTWDLPKGVKNKAPGKPRVTLIEVAPEKKYMPPAQTYNQQRNGNVKAASQRSNMSRPNGGSNYSAPATQRHKHGIKVNDNLAYCPIAICNSQTTQATYLEGIAIEKPWPTVRIYGLSKAVMDQHLKAGCEMTANVIAMSGQGIPEEYLILRGDSIKTGAPFIDVLDDRPEDEDEDDLITLVPGPTGKLIDEKEFDEYAKHGCGMCSCDVDFEDEVNWVADAPICLPCHLDNSKGN